MTIDKKVFLKEYYNNHDDVHHWKKMFVEYSNIFDNHTLILKKRQTGKTQFILDIILSILVCENNKNIVLVTYNKNQSKYMIDKIKLMCRNNDKICPNFTTENRIDSINFDNGNKIKIVNKAEECRGYKIDYFLHDEICFTPKLDVKKYFSSIFPCIASSNGKIFAISTKDTMQIDADFLKIFKVYEYGVRIN